MNCLDQVIHAKYKIIKTIGKGSLSTVYLAQSLKDENLVAVKILNNNLISHRLEDYIRFQNEVKIVSALNHPHIIKILDHGQFNNYNYIVTEYIEGKSLSQLYKSNQKLNMNKVINIGIQLCDTLSYLHNENIIHKDIKPGNIMITKDLKSIKLIDFGLSYLLDSNSFFNTDSISGSIAYISPEQSGILKRPLDHRSDLYSLGISLYELFTEHPPFSDTDFIKLIYKHLAHTPSPPSHFNKDIPPVLDEIILKLLAKEPTDRYQTAIGLKKDLQNLLDHPGENFILANKDITKKMNYYIPLIGRQLEYALLKQSYEKSKTKLQSVVINATAGVGKSKIVESFKEDIIASNPLFLSFKCNLSEKNNPYLSIKTILKHFFEHHANFYHKDLLKILNEHSPFLKDLLPYLKDKFKHIINNENQLSEENSNQNKMELMITIEKLFQYICSNYRHLIIYFDDIQWMDQESFEVLNYLILKLSNKPLLFIFTSRQETQNASYLKTILPDSIIHLNPLNLQDIKLLVNKVLLIPTNFNLNFYHTLNKLSLGNPFYIFQILQDFNQQKILFFKNNEWQIDLEKLKIYQFEIDMTQIIDKKLSLLNKEDLVVLKIASVLGKEFHLHFLSETTFLIKENLKQNSSSISYFNNIIKSIDLFIHLQLIEEKIELRKRVYSFTHDKIKEYIYSKIGKNERLIIHKTCAKILIENNKDINEVIFDIAYHYNQLIINEIDIEKYLLFNELAYKKALANFSIKETIFYMKNYVDTCFLKHISDDKFFIILAHMSFYMLITGNIPEGLNYLLKANKLISEKKLIKEKIYINYFISLAYHYNGDLKNLLKYSEQAIFLIKNNPDLFKDSKELYDQNIGEIFRIAGTAYLHLTQFEKSKNYLTIAIDLINNLDDILHTRGIRILTLIQLLDINGIKKDINEIEKNITLIKNKVIKTMILPNSSYFYSLIGDPEKAHGLCTQSLKISKESNIVFNQFLSSLALIHSYFYLDNYKEGIEIGLQTVQFVEKYKINLLKDTLWSYICYLYLLDKNYPKVKEITTQFLAQKNIDFKSKFNFLFSLGLCEFIENNIFLSWKTLCKAYEYSKKINSFLNQLNILPFLIYLSQQVGDQNKENFFTKELHKLKKAKPHIQFLINNLEQQKYQFIQAKLDYANQKKESSYLGFEIKDKIKLKNIKKITEMLVSISDINPLLETILEKTLEITGAQSGAFLLFNKQNNDETIISKNNHENSIFRISKKVIEQVKKEQKGFIFHAIEKNNPIEPSQSIINQKIRSILSVPLIFNDQIFGVLYLESRVLDQLFNHEDLEVLEIFATQATMALQNYKKNQIQNNLNQQNKEQKFQSICQKFKISKREKEIIKLILKGLTNQKIAKELFISLGTAKNHLHNILEKFEVKKRTEIGSLFYE